MSTFIFHIIFSAIIGILIDLPGHLFISLFVFDWGSLGPPDNKLKDASTCSLFTGLQPGSKPVNFPLLGGHFTSSDFATVKLQPCLAEPLKHFSIVSCFFQIIFKPQTFIRRALSHSIYQQFTANSYTSLKNGSLITGLLTLNYPL